MISVGEPIGVEVVASDVRWTVTLDEVISVSVVACSVMVEAGIAVEMEVVRTPDVVDCITNTIVVLSVVTDPLVPFDANDAIVCPLGGGRAVEGSVWF